MADAINRNKLIASTTIPLTYNNTQYGVLIFHKYSGGFCTVVMKSFGQGACPSAITANYPNGFRPVNNDYNDTAVGCDAVNKIVFYPDYFTCYINVNYAGIQAIYPCDA